MKSTCIYCKGNKYKKKKINDIYLIRCLGCNALYEDEESIRNEEQLQKELEDKVYMYNGRK